MMADPEYDRENQRRYAEALEGMTPAQFEWQVARQTGDSPADCPECGGSLRPTDLSALFECAECGEPATLSRLRR